MSYTYTKTDEGWTVTDEFANVLAVTDTRAQAREFVRGLDAPKSNVRHYEGTYGTGEKATVTEAPVMPDVITEAPVVPDVITEAPVVPDVITEAPVMPDVITEAPKKGFRENDGTKPMTKAQRVREFIRGIKPNGGTEEEVVNFCIGILGMKKPLAKVYAKDNWARV
jgi:hypothetical protein